MVMNLLAPSAVPRSASDDGELRRQIVNEVIEAVNREFSGEVLRSPDEAEREKVRGQIHVLVGKAYRRRELSPTMHDQASITDEVARRVMGLGFLDLLLPPARTDLSEITVYSSGLIQVMPKGSVRWETVDLRVDRSEVWIVLEKLLGPQSKALNEATPSINARLPATRHNPGGGRVKALHPVIVPGGGYPAVNIRLYEQKPVHPEWLLERQLMDAEMMEFLGEAVRKGLRLLIAGGTRTGKTTLLSALCNFLPEKWRIIKIEEPAEIWIDRPTVQTIEARPVNPGSEVKPYTLADGVDDAMRMSPDYLVIGEVRDGWAALALLRALMTGHSGACTFHADTPHETFERLATLMGTDCDVRPGDAARVIASSVDLLVQIGIRHETRRVTTIANIAREAKGGSVRFTRLWRYDEDSPPAAPRWKKIEVSAAEEVGEDAEEES